CDDAITALHEAGGHAKTAIVMVLLGMTATQARARLAEAGGVVRVAVDENHLRL
ncbi:N-acetylmuramic acid 6-phosphate etherase, partial [Pseudomonas sp. GW456-12-10-14-LB2]